MELARARELSTFSLSIGQVNSQCGMRRDECTEQMAISNSNNSFQLNCFMLGDKHFNPYPLEVSSNWTLQKLEDNITQRHERIMHQTLINVRLYQIDSTIEELPNLSPEEDLKLMRRMHRVREYWPHPEQVDWHRVHVVVVADDIVAIPPAVVPPPTADQNQSNTPTPDVQVGEIIQRFKNAQLQYCASVKLCSASTAAKPTEFAKKQKGNNYMLNGRPRQHTGPAIVLYHPVFGNFLSNLQSSDSLPPKFYELGGSTSRDNLGLPLMRQPLALAAPIA
ncbi:hypothetical protein OPQ81_001103 [Rhizoctonia solani]|nr:hypothetical protein OPQ81_001103 [Rhizoctonia solani]